MTIRQPAARCLAILSTALLLTALCMSMFPVTASADDGLDHTDQYYHFDSLPVLRKILELESDEEIWATETRDFEYTLNENLISPTGKKVFFGTGKVTVKPGVTVTVEEDAALFFYEMDIDGTIINRGDLVQCEPREGEDHLLRINGTVINSDWFYYRHAEGLENVENLDSGRMFTDKKTEAEREPAPKPSPAATPTVNPGSLEYRLRRFFRQLGWSVSRFYRLNQEAIQKAAPYVIVVLGGLLSSALTKKKKQGSSEAKHGNRSYAGTRRSGSTEEVFIAGKTLTEDQKKRIRHLDEWLESGLIDRAEYKVLKERYERER